jgi:hypothetical protein
MRVVEEMRSKWDHYSAFVVESDRDGYLDMMASASTYAGHAELYALSAVWGVTIQVWGAETTHTISASGDLTRPTINLVHRDASDAGGGLFDHYWAGELPE